MPQCRLVMNLYRGIFLFMGYELWVVMIVKLEAKSLISYRGIISIKHYLLTGLESTDDALQLERDKGLPVNAVVRGHLWLSHRGI